MRQFNAASITSSPSPTGCYCCIKHIIAHAHIIYNIIYYNSKYYYSFKYLYDAHIYSIYCHIIVGTMFVGSSQELCARMSISFRRLSGDETHRIPFRFRLVAGAGRVDRRADVEIRQSYRKRRRRRRLIIIYNV